MLLDAIVNLNRAMTLVSRKLTLSGKLDKQRIHDMDHRIVQNKRSV